MFRNILVCSGLMVIGLILAGQSSAAIDQASIAGIWLFDEGDGQDASENGNDGELVGDIKEVEGKFGKALEFPGTEGNYVSTGEKLEICHTGRPGQTAFRMPKHGLEIADYTLSLGGLETR